MGEVVPPSEERLSLALQDIDQLLGELEVHLASYDVSRDTPESDVQPVDDDQIKQTEQEQLRGGAHGVGTPDSDALAPPSAGDTTGEGPEEGENAFREVPSNQRAQGTVKARDG